MPITAAPLNADTPIVDRQSGTITRYFQNVWRDLTSRVESAAFAAPGQIVSVSAQSAAILATALVVSTAQPIYRVSYDLRIAIAAGVSSAAQVTIGWTQGGIAQTYTGANVNGNTTTSRDSGVVILRPDAGTVITYAASYASNAAGVMNFEADFIAEGLG